MLWSLSSVAVVLCYLALYDQQLVLQTCHVYCRVCCYIETHHLPVTIIVIPLLPCWGFFDTELLLVTCFPQMEKNEHVHHLDVQLSRKISKSH